MIKILIDRKHLCKVKVGDLPLGSGFICEDHDDLYIKVQYYGRSDFAYTIINMTREVVVIPDREFHDREVIEVDVDITYSPIME